MSGKLNWIVFWALAGTATIVVGWFLVAAVSEFARGFPFLVFLFTAGAVAFLLGIALIFLSVKEKVAGLLGMFFILTGTAAVATPLSLVLHNVVYGLFINWFGVDFWDRVGLGDEPFFFVLGIFVCPAAFLVGVAGSIVLAIKKREITG